MFEKTQTFCLKCVPSFHTLKNKEKKESVYIIVFTIMIYTFGN